MKRKTGTRRKPEIESLAGLSEKALLAMVKADDSRAWAELSTRLEPLIKGEAMSILVELPQEIPDILYQAKNRLWDKRHLIRSKRGVRKWMRLVARTLSLKRKKFLEKNAQYLQVKTSDEGVKDISKKPGEAVEVEESKTHEAEIASQERGLGIPDSDERFRDDMQRRLRLYGRRALDRRDEEIGWLLWGRDPLTRPEAAKHLGIAGSVIESAVKRIKSRLEAAENKANSSRGGQGI